MRQRHIRLAARDEEARLEAVVTRLENEKASSPGDLEHEAAAEGRGDFVGVWGECRSCHTVTN